MMKNALKKRLKTMDSPFFLRISVKEVTKKRIDGITIMARIKTTSPLVLLQSIVPPFS